MGAKFRSRTPTFIAGAIVGGAVVFAANKIGSDHQQEETALHPTQLEVQPTQIGRANESVPAIMPEPSSQPHERFDPTTDIDDLVEESENAFDSRGYERASPRPVEPGVQQAIPVSDAHEQLLGTENGQATSRSDIHAELEREPEDDSWSYFMEQALRQHFSQHKNSRLFTIFNVECRTTICEIQSIGYDDSTAPDWQRILYDLEQQPWYDFGQVGTSRAEYQGELAIVTHLRRRD